MVSFIITLTLYALAIILILIGIESEDTWWLTILVSAILFFYIVYLKREKADLTCRNQKLIEKNDKVEKELTNTKKDFEKQLKEQTYKYSFITKLYPDINTILKENKIVYKDNTKVLVKDLFETVDILQKPRSKQESELLELKNRVALLEASQSNLTAIPYMASIMADYETYGIEVLAKQLDWGWSYKREEKVQSIREIRQEAQQIAYKHREAKYQLDYLLTIFPKLSDFLQVDFSKIDINNYQEYFETESNILSAKIMGLEMRIKFLESSQSNLKEIPYMAEIMADYETYGLEALAKQLDWGWSTERQKKVASIRDIRNAAKEMVQKNLEAKYQLAYLLNLFPALEDVLDTEYEQLPIVKIEDLSEYDKTRDWLSKEEFQKLSTVERNQLALDRYFESHNKSKWQIGRDYELYVGYYYTKKGYDVDYFGSYMGMEDLGRDLILKKGETVTIVQCKYWSQEKTIHEKHIMQLYGTITSYKIEHDLPSKKVKGIFVTNIELSDTAKRMAEYLSIKFIEHFEKGIYPCIKCNIGKDEYGSPTKIYHLPFDQQYDSAKIKDPGEFFAMTVQEAEDAGFRRAFKWFGNNS